MWVELPQEDFIFIADSDHAPCGERDEAQVIARSPAITACLEAKNIKALVIACNTANAAAIDLLLAQHPLQIIIGIEPTLKFAIPFSKTRRNVMMRRAVCWPAANFCHYRHYKPDRPTVCCRGMRRPG